jgi:hypothetical protein
MWFYMRAFDEPAPHRRLQIMYRALCLLVFAISMPVHAGELPPGEAARIEYLLTAVRELQGAEFIRNGMAHDASSAAVHLRRKLNAAGARIKSADDFIDLCASASSITGRPYRIRFQDGSEIDARQYLRQKLAEYPAAASRVERPGAARQ